MSLLICSFDGKQWNYEIKSHKETHRDGGICLTDLKRPKMPIGRVMKEGASHICKRCYSTASKKGFLGLFGERTCDNKECKNHKSKFKRL